MHVVGGQRGRVTAWATAALLVFVAACGGAARTPVAAAPVPTPAPQPSPSRVDVGSIDSALLGEQLPYAVYLPAGYDSDPMRRYGVLYLLHGMDGSFRQWLDLGLAARADDLFASRAVPAFLVVMPEGERGYWMDQAAGGPRWGSYVTDELVGAIDARYRTVARREARAIGGLSMGAHGALQLSLNHPDEFAAVGAHSPALRAEKQAMPYFGRGHDFQVRDPISLVAAHPDVARRLALWLDIGDHDLWAPRAEALHDELLGYGIPHEWQERPGDHSGTYWSARLGDYLRFYGTHLSVGR